MTESLMTSQNPNWDLSTKTFFVRTLAGPSYVPRQSILYGTLVLLSACAFPFDWFLLLDFDFRQRERRRGIWNGIFLFCCEDREEHDKIRSKKSVFFYSLL